MRELTAFSMTSARSSRIFWILRSRATCSVRSAISVCRSSRFLRSASCSCGSSFWILSLRKRVSHCDTLEEEETYLISSIACMRC